MANDDKLWTQPAMQAIATTAALEAIQSQGGLALPCKVIALNPNSPVTGEPLGYSFVQVQFEVTFPYTMQDGTAATFTLPPLVLPKAEGQWVRSPTQIGDLGVTQAVDTSHGGVSGLSAGVPSVGTAYGNLSTLVFVPVGNTGFGAAPDPNKVWVNGPSGAVTSDTAQTATTVHEANNITHTAGVGTANQVKTIYDGNGNAISHVVSSGGLIGLGALTSTLGAARAVPAQADLQTAVNNVVNTSMVKLMAAVGAAMGTSSTTWSTAQAQLNTIFSASSFVPNISGILPAIPNCSSIVRVAS